MKNSEIFKIALVIWLSIVAIIYPIFFHEYGIPFIGDNVWKIVPFYVRLLYGWSVIYFMFWFLTAFIVFCMGIDKIFTELPILWGKFMNWLDEQ